MDTAPAAAAVSDGELRPSERRAITHATHERYRADIDGLRAIAVLPVLFYHVGVRGFSGGFVGVDVFFVISGYLITAILVRDLAVGRHSIAEFYRRRILRIFPALSAVIVATALAAGLFLLPPELPSFARSVASTAVFGSNLLFYATTDYFNLGATSQPLLHTWSLAVEEQFYILWPLVLAALVRRPRVMIAVALGVTAASLLFSIYLLPRDPTATFYLLPTRAWELGLGALAAMLPLRLARPVAQAVGAVGLLLILASVKLYTHETAFPGLAALAPCVGAAMIIASGAGQTWTARLLSLAPLVFVGRISYSLYLWHWPVIVFAGIGLLLPQTLATSATIVAVSLGLAYLSYRFVELPFRHDVSGWPTRSVLAGGAGVIVALLLLAVVVSPLARSLNGFTPAQTATARYLAFNGDANYRGGKCFRVGPRERYDAASCLTPQGNRPVALLVGDSQAAHLWPGLARHRATLDILQMTVTGCVASRYPQPKGYCQQMEDDLLGNWLARHHVDLLILSSRWKWNNIGSLTGTLADPAVRASHPVVIGPIPEYSGAVPRLIVWADRRRDPGLVARALDTDVFALDDRVRAIARAADVPYISLVALLCKGRTCRATVGSGVPLLFDPYHLTNEGSAFVADRIMPALAARTTAR